MKLQLDTENKTIRLESKVSLKEFMEVIKKLLPNNDWQEFSLETNVTINNWSNPIIIKEIEKYPVYPKPIWYSNTGDYDNTKVNPTFCSGTYNVEL
jgi:hypothetical protein